MRPERNSLPQLRVTRDPEVHRASYRPGATGALPDGTGAADLKQVHAAHATSTRRSEEPGGSPQAKLPQLGLRQSQARHGANLGDGGERYRLGIWRLCRYRPRTIEPTVTAPDDPPRAVRLKCTASRVRRQ